MKRLKKKIKNLFQTQTSSVHSVQPELPFSVFLQRTESEEAAKPMHSVPSIVYHQSWQKMILIFLKKVILEHYLQANRKATL